jgi:general secretion pathway protein E
MGTRYPLPYAFARSQQMLLENLDGDLTLWLHGWCKQRR